MNHVSLMGRLVATPVLANTSTGIPFVRFTLAVNRDYLNADRQRDADFIDCVAWRGTAEFIAKYFVKGGMIALCGSLRTQTYTDKAGVNRKIYEVVAENAYFTGEKR